MKTYILIVFTLVSFSINAQSYVYTLDFLHSKRKLKTSKYQPQIYSTTYKDVVKTYGGKSEEVKNPEYEDLELALLELLDEKESEKASYLTNKREVEDIRVFINNFLGSKESYEDKKHWLIDAQSVAEVHGFDFLIYADDVINASHNSKFKILRLNSLDLKVHLKRVVWEIENYAVQVPNNVSELTGRIDSLELEMGKIDEFLVSKTKKVTKRRKGLFVNRLMSLDQNILSGEFIKKGTCYIVNKNYYTKGKSFEKGEIIYSKEASTYGLINKNLVGRPKVIFQKKDKNTRYIADANFLKSYAFTINGKFNSTNSNAGSEVVLTK